MSQENVEGFKRALEAWDRRDLPALLDELDPEVEWHPALARLLGGDATVYRGHGGVRRWAQDMDETFAEIQFEFGEIRDLDDRVLARGRMRARAGRVAPKPSRPWPTSSSTRTARRS